ncbi:MAG: type III pantothenate kinase [Saprospiraceae bacterium]
MLNLCIDIGNTRIKMGYFAGQQLVDTLTLTIQEIDHAAAFLTNQTVEKVIFSTVSGPLPEGITKWLPSKTKVLELNTKLDLPFEVAYQTPQTLGLDRVAAVAGAYALFAETACLVIDAGTCVTYDVLTAEGIYLGGNISPGWQMRLDAMHHFTAKLPRPDALAPQKWIGNSTESALQNGAFKGLLWEMEGCIQQLQSDFTSINVILTGGDADFFAKKLKSKIFVNQNLVLWGLNKILNYNA